MTSTLRFVTLSSLLAVATVTAATAVETGLDSLAGSWRTAPEATGDTIRAAATMDARAVLQGDWLRVELETSTDQGRATVEHLMVRQQGDDSVVAYLFAPGMSEPMRLTGGWREAEGLMLASREGDEAFVWRPESGCDAVLSRRRAAGAAKTRLRKNECDPARIADAATEPAAPTATTPEGRPIDSEPSAVGAEPMAEAPASDAGPREDPRGDRNAGGEAEIAVADLPVARPSVPEATDAGRTVILAGRGKPLDEVRKAIEMLREFLAENGVRVEGPSDEIVVLQEADASLAYLVREVRDRRAASLLYVSASFGGRERIIVDCYDERGVLLWREKTVGGTGMRDFKWMNPRLVERIEEKLLPRVGGIGLPADKASTP